MSSPCSPDTTSVAVIPCVTALDRDDSFPEGDRGPVLRCALRRLASTWRRLVIGRLPWRSLGGPVTLRFTPQVDRPVISIGSRPPDTLLFLAFFPGRVPERRWAPPPAPRAGVWVRSPIVLHICSNRG